MYLLDRVPRWIAALLLFDAALVAASVLNFLVGAPFARLSLVLHLDSEISLQAWYSSMQWLGAGVLLGVVSLHLIVIRAAGMIALATLAALCVAFSIDEIVGMHEWLGRKSDAMLPGGDRKATPLWRTGVWPLLIGAPVLLLIAGLTARLRRVFAGRPRAYRKLIAGLVIMFAGALAVELAVNLIDAGAEGWLLLQLSVEEFMEMAGVTLIVWSAYELLLSYGFELRGPAARGASVRAGPALRLTDPPGS